jgi:acyl-CoA thioester hydrolase
VAVAMSDPREHTRADYRHFLAIPTRWMDNDTYGHVNNVTYYSYFDTVVNEHLVNEGGLDIREGEVVGFVVETSCRYFRPITFPETIEAGMRITRLGRSSVTYEIALFRRGEPSPAAAGRFVHVWVDRRTVTPAEIPAQIRAILQPLAI